MVEGNKNEDCIYIEYLDIMIFGGQDVDVIWLDNFDIDMVVIIFGFDSIEDIMVVEVIYILSGVGDIVLVDFLVDDVFYILIEQIVDGVVQIIVILIVDLIGIGLIGFYDMILFILVGVF